MHTLRNMLPDITLFILIIACALITDSVLHLTGQTGWGRYMGHAGSLLLLLSFVYSARKRKWIRWGNPRIYLRFHEVFAWIGSIMILVHGGIHFNAFLPWMALAAMLVVLASGLTGRYLLRRAIAVVHLRRDDLIKQGLRPEEADDRLFWDALVVETMKKWRAVHFAVTAVFIFLALLHAASILIFWKW